MANTTTIRVAIGYGQALEVEATIETLNALKKAKVVDTRWVGDNRYDYSTDDAPRIELANPVKWTQTQVDLIYKKHREAEESQTAAETAE